MNKADYCPENPQNKPMAAATANKRGTDAPLGNRNSQGWRAISSANIVIEMTTELRDLTAEHFEALIGETFEIDGQKTVLRSVRRGPPTPSRFRDQFALTFDTPANTKIRSDVVSVIHPAVGEHNLLVTQVIHSVQPTALEICFG
ncbi:hypothetical protein [uncultured Sphingorhabdus sp.]|uniref:DUF6916 family protein n=1 Tax=uncultured Sphingorhabdus sp. TaxID=1686106 RepID=UPI00260BDC52|nr:hypothetical protein [uncultured Sphingorhabdus sp.]